MQRGAGQVDVVPAPGRLVNHAFLYGVDIGPGRSGWPGQSDAFAAIAVAREAFVGDARALVQAVRAGMAEAAVIHIPAMQTRPAGQRGVPGKRVESARGAVTVHLVEELLGQLDFFGSHWRRRAPGRGSWMVGLDWPGWRCRGKLPGDANGR